MKNILEKIPLILILAFGFFLPFSVAVCYGILGLIFMFWLFKGDKNRTKTIFKNSKLAQWSIIWLILHFLGVIWTSDINSIFITIKKPIYLALFPIIMSFIRVTNINVMLNTFVLAIFIYHIIIYGIHFNFWTIESMQVGGTPFMNRVHYSPMLVFAMIILFFQQKKWSPGMRIIALMTMMSFFISLIITEGRTGQILLFGLSSILACLEVKNKKSLFITFLAIVCLVIGLSFFSHTFQQRFQQFHVSWANYKQGNTHSSLGERLHHIDASFRLFMEKPLVGFGTGSYKNEHQRLIKTYYPPDTINSNHPHNQYLITLVQFGVFGLSILLTLPLLLLRFYLRTPEHQYRNLVLVFIIGFFTILVADLFLYAVPSLTTFIYLSSIFFHPDWATLEAQ